MPVIEEGPPLRTRFKLILTLFYFVKWTLENHIVMMVDIIQKKLYTFVIYPRHTKNTKYTLKVIPSVHSVNKNVVKFSVDYNQKKNCPI